MKHPGILIVLISAWALSACDSPDNTSSNDGAATSPEVPAAVLDYPLPASDSTNEGGWVLINDLSDEFDGDEIDHSKWWVQGLNGEYYIWKGRPPSQYAAHNVIVEEGFLKIRTQWEPDFPFAQENYADGGRDDRYGELDGKKIPVTTAAVVSKKRFINGYMEIRSKSNPTSMTSAFWLIGFEQELDVFEHIGAPQADGSFGAEHTALTVHDWSPPAIRPTRAFGFSKELPYKVGDEYHIYAVEWGVDYLKFYLDGELLYTQTREHLGLDWVINNPMEIWLDSEVFKWIAVPYENEQWPSDFEIDYVRVWQKPSANLLRDHRAFFGFEGPMIFDDAGRPLDLLPEDPTPNDYQKFWIIPEGSERSFRITENRWFNGVNSLKYSTISDQGDVSANAPAGSIDLPAGEYELSFKILVKNGRQPEFLHMNLNSPDVKIAFPLADTERGKWITLRQRFVKETASNPDDYLSIEILQSEVPKGGRDFFIDDIQIESISENQND